MSESLLVGAVLAVSGGFFDVYTYLCRGGVFANAQTGNIVLLGMRLASGDYRSAVHYLLSIAAFVLGVMLAERVKQYYRQRQRLRLHWRQIVVLAEMALLTLIAFLPQSYNTAANMMISFLCAMQVETFRKVRGSAFATTMCTGNLRSGTEQLVLWLQSGSRESALRARNYCLIILCFILGAVLGAVLTERWKEPAILLPCALLLVVFVVMFVEEERRAS